MALGNLNNIMGENLRGFTAQDITLYMAGKPLYSALSVTYSITREVVALFGFGDPNAQGFNRGKRGIAGTLVFNQYQGHPLLRTQWAIDLGLFKEDQELTLANVFGNAANKDAFKATLDDYAFNNGTYQVGTNPNFAGGTFNLSDPTLKSELTDTYNWVANRKFNYVDQLPPTDIVLTFVNEMGVSAYMSINGCVFANEGGGFSVDDITSETAFTYIARSITPMRAFMPKNSSSRTLISGFGPTKGGI